MAKIQFNQNLLLSDWVNNEDKFFTRYEVYLYGLASDIPDLNFSHGSAQVIIYTDSGTVNHIRFHGHLYAYDALFNPGNKTFNLTLKDAKVKVDNFIIRMSKLQGLL